MKINRFLNEVNGILKEINEIEQEMASGSRAADEKGKKATAITAVMLSLFIVALMLI